MRMSIKILLVLLVCYMSSPVFSQIPSHIGVVNHDTVHVITWTDAKGLTGETYNVYVSSVAITDIMAEDVYRIGTGIPENEGQYEYMLYTPGSPEIVNYYYAVTVASNDIENTSLSAGGNTTTTAETGSTTWALPVIWIDGEHFQSPSIDGDIGEWQPLFSVFLNPDSPENSVALENIDGPSDQSATCWLAADEDNLYFAGTVTDDVLVNPIPPGASDQWKGDVVEYYMGLYDLRPSDAPHDDYQVGDEPDYEMHIKANAGTNLLNTHIYDNGKANPSDLVWPSGKVNTDSTGTNGNWNYEGRLPFSALTWDAVAFPTRFVPQIGMVLPINIMTCDADDPNAALQDLRQGQLSWSNHSLSKDSWTRPDVWKHYTVIYDPKQLHAAITGVEEQQREGRKPIPQEHGLFQNYPNPFPNPVGGAGWLSGRTGNAAETTVQYQLLKSSYVRLELYDFLGRQVRTLVDVRKQAGTHRIKWDGRDELGREVASGIYLCKMSAADIVETRKLLLLR